MGNDDDLNKKPSGNSSDDSKEENAGGTTGDAEQTSAQDSPIEAAQPALPEPAPSQPVPGVTTTAESAIINRPQGTKEDRTSLWDGCVKTFRYIGVISQDKSLSFRSSDKLTTRLLVIALAGAVVFAFMPAFNLPVAAAAFYVTADIVLMAAIVVFVLARIGIIRAMEPRYALVCWHLMVGTALLFLTIGFNVLAAIVLFLMRDQLTFLIGGS